MAPAFKAARRQEGIMTLARGAERVDEYGLASGLLRTCDLWAKPQDFMFMGNLLRRLPGGSSENEIKTVPGVAPLDGDGATGLFQLPTSSMLVCVAARGWSNRPKGCLWYDSYQPYL